MRVGIRELRDRLKHYVDAARGGEDVIITDHGKAVARLVALQRERPVDRLVRACTVVSVADHLVDQAGELSARYELRAADAIHLATALAVLDADSVLVTWDEGLRQAGLQAGLVTAPAGS